MNLFRRYPKQGRESLGRLQNLTGACRSGYGLALQRLTGQSSCAYCGVLLTDTYDHWLLMSVDHVVPQGEARRLGIPIGWYDDAINQVLCCSGCNGFGNRYGCAALPQECWTLEQFVALRDAVFADRTRLIAARRARELALFASKPWDTTTPIVTLTTSAQVAMPAQRLELCEFALMDGLMPECDTSRMIEEVKNTAEGRKQ